MEEAEEFDVFVHAGKGLVFGVVNNLRGIGECSAGGPEALEGFVLEGCG